MQERNHLWVNWLLQNNAKSNRKYPTILPNGTVRAHVKPKLCTKGHEPKWNSTRHKVIRTDGSKHLIDYLPKENYC